MADLEKRAPQGKLQIGLERAVVARGRSLDVPIEGDPIIVGTDADNEPVTRARTRRVGPGQEVELPADEVRVLRASGFLVDPSNLAPPVATGAGIVADGPGQIRGV